MKQILKKISAFHYGLFLFSFVVAGFVYIQNTGWDIAPPEVFPEELFYEQN